jgi:hypothetical protein
VQNERIVLDEGSLRAMRRECGRKAYNRGVRAAAKIPVIAVEELSFRDSTSQAQFTKEQILRLVKPKG